MKFIRTKKHWHKESGKVDLYDEQTGDYYQFNEFGTAIWELCDGEKTISEIANVLKQTYCSEDMEEDVRDFIINLEDNKFIQNKATMRKLHILLIEPWLFGGVFVQSQERVKQYMKSNLIGLSSIAAYLNLMNFESKIIDLRNDSFYDFGKALLDYQPKVVGISVNSFNFYNGIAAATFIKQTLPHAYIVLGGIHCAFTHREILGTYPFIDAVVLGEGEVVFYNLVKSIRDKGELEPIEGVSVRVKNKVIISKSRPLEDNLDKFPIPDYFRYLYYPTNISNYDSWMITRSRGCIYSCAFCAQGAFWGNKIRYRSVNYMIKEIKYIKKKYKITNFDFVDDFFTKDKDELKLLCNLLMELNISWSCSTRLEWVDELTLKLMKNAGCTSIFFGLETHDPKVLRLINKGSEKTITHVDRVRKSMRKIGLKMCVSFILPLPGYNKNSLVNLLDFIKKMNFDKININFLVPLPGTKIWDNKDLIFIRKGWPEERIPMVTTEHLSQDEMLNFLPRILRAIQ